MLCVSRLAACAKQLLWSAAAFSSMGRAGRERSSVCGTYPHQLWGTNQEGVSYRSAGPRQSHHQSSWNPWQAELQGTGHGRDPQAQILPETAVVTCIPRPSWSSTGPLCLVCAFWAQCFLSIMQHKLKNYIRVTVHFALTAQPKRKCV